MSLTPGDLLQDKYRIIRLLGQGGMGAVYEGENVVIARRVAIKVLHGALAGDEAVIERFEREAQAAGRIGNEHILEVLDMGRLPNNDRFMVMEYLDGETLDARCERLGRLSEDEVYPLARQLLTGLAAAHAAGIVHRDLKPDNVFIVEQKLGHKDFVKIIDFGISKFMPGSANFTMTMTGAIMGTPYYMSPEQAKGSKNADARSDLYAVGVVLFRALSGQVPFHGDTFNELIFKVALSETPRVSQLVPHINAGIDDIVYRAMARSADDRFQTAAQFRDALDEWALERGLLASLPHRSGHTQPDPSSRVQSHTSDETAGPTPAAPVPHQSTHVPWSSTGSNKARVRHVKWWLGLAAAAAIGLVAWSLADTDTTNTTLAAPSVQALTSAAPAPPATASGVDVQEQTEAPEPAASVAASLPEPQPSATADNDRWVGDSAATQSPPRQKPAAGSPVRPAKRAPAAVPRPRPAAKPSVARPKSQPRPTDILGY